jgi:predicted RNase H-like nuclease (RuvC/YqgF family)
MINFVVCVDACRATQIIQDQASKIIHLEEVLANLATSKSALERRVRELDESVSKAHMTKTELEAALHEMRQGLAEATAGSAVKDLKLKKLAKEMQASGDLGKSAIVNMMTTGSIPLATLLTPDDEEEVLLVRGHKGEFLVWLAMILRSVLSRHMPFRSQDAQSPVEQGRCSPTAAAAHGSAQQPGTQAGA